MKHKGVRILEYIFLCYKFVQQWLTEHNSGEIFENNSGSQAVWKYTQIKSFACGIVDMIKLYDLFCIIWRVDIHSGIFWLFKSEHQQEQQQ